MAALSELYREMASCQSCGLAQHRTQVVPGEGTVDTDILFVGEAPGYNEDRLGRPFVGAAGVFLDGLLASIGMGRSDVYIANIIKCRPPGNRDPGPGEIAACKPWLDRQMEMIRPKVIVTLGRVSLSRFRPNESISKVHGKPIRMGEFVLFPMYHPAAALHQGGLRNTLESDMLLLPKILKELRSIDAVSRGDDSHQQLTLF